MGVAISSLSLFAQSLLFSRNLSSLSAYTAVTLPASIVTGVNQASWKYYQYNVAAGRAHRLTLTMVIPPSTSTADADLYVKKGSVLPTRSSYDWSHTGTQRVSVLDVPGQSVSSQYVVGVYGFTTVAQYRLEIAVSSVCPNDCSGHGTCNAATQVCTCSNGYYGVSCNETIALAPNGEVSEVVSRGAWKYYYVMIPAGAEALNVSVSQIGMSGNSGDVDLYIKKGSLPTFASFDFADSSTRDAFHINIPSPQIGAAYYIGFYGFAETQFRWSARVTTTTANACPNECSGDSHGTCRAGNQQQGTCQCQIGFSGPSCAQMTRDLVVAPQAETITGYVAQNEWNFYSVTPASASPLTINVKHSSGQDCDIYVQRDRNPSRFDFLYRDITYSINTNLVIQNPLDSAWKIGVLGFSACTYEITVTASATTTCPTACTANGGTCPNGNNNVCICPQNKAGEFCQYSVTPIRSGQTVQGNVGKNQWAFYRFDGPASAFSIVLNEDSVPPNAGVLWLYSSVLQSPTLHNYDWSDTNTGTNTHRINVEIGQFIQNAHYYIGVFGSPYAINGQNTFKLTTWAAPFKK